VPQIEWTEETVLAAARGEIEAHWGGQPVRYRLSRDQWQRFNDAMRSAYLHGYVGEKDAAASNIWYRWCAVRREPYVRLMQRGSKASLEIDLVAHHTHLSFDESARIAELIEPLYPPSRRERVRMGKMWHDSYRGSHLRNYDPANRGLLDQTLEQIEALIQVAAQKYGEGEP